MSSLALFLRMVDLERLSVLVGLIIPFVCRMFSSLHDASFYFDSFPCLCWCHHRPNVKITRRFQNGLQLQLTSGLPHDLTWYVCGPHPTRSVSLVFTVSELRRHRPLPFSSTDVSPSIDLPVDPDPCPE